MGISIAKVRIQEIKENKKQLSNTQIVDSFLELDADNVDLGSQATTEELAEAKTISLMLLEEIKPYDIDTYKLLKRGFDA